MEKEIEIWLIETYSKIGMDIPTNHYDIVKYIKNDVESTADLNKYHSGDFGIAFRRCIEELEF